VDRHRFDANRDPYRYPNLYSDADQEPDADWHPNDADPIRILFQVLHMLEIQKIISLTFTALTVFSFSLWLKVS
jgi:hypothetical protein